MRKLLLLFLFICGLVLHAQAQKNVELSSPNGEIKVSVRLTDKIYYDVACNDEVLLKDNYLQLKLKDKILGEHPKLSGQKQNKIKETLTPVVPLKFSTINNEYNQLCQKCVRNQKRDQILKHTLEDIRAPRTPVNRGRKIRCHKNSILFYSKKLSRIIPQLRAFVKTVGTIQQLFYKIFLKMCRKVSPRIRIRKDPVRWGAFLKISGGSSYCFSSRSMSAISGQVL